MSVQREIFGSWVVEAGYTGNRGYDLTVETDMNQIPVQYLSTSPTRDKALIDNLSQPVANPFAGLLPGDGLNSANVARSQLLRPYPQFTQVQSRNFDGTSSYQSGQFRLERALLGRLLVPGDLHCLEIHGAGVRAESQDATRTTRSGFDVDVPHRVVLNGILELPFGRGRKCGSDWNPVPQRAGRRLERLGDLAVAERPSADLDASATSTTTATSPS